MSESSRSRKSAGAGKRGGSSPPCPICRRPAAPREQNPVFPFCQERCRLVDLGRWLGEEYRIPGDPADLSDPRSEES